MEKHNLTGLQITGMKANSYEGTGMALLISAVIIFMCICMTIIVGIHMKTKRAMILAENKPTAVVALKYADLRSKIAAEYLSKVVTPTENLSAKQKLEIIRQVDEQINCSDVALSARRLLAAADVYPVFRKDIVKINHFVNTSRSMILNTGDGSDNIEFMMGCK